MFTLPTYTAPDFSTPTLLAAPDARWAPAPADGIAPEGYHATTVFPEYLKLEGQWRLLEVSRMDCVVVRADDRLTVKPFRHLRQGEAVLMGRSEDGGEGILVHANGFGQHSANGDAFAFRLARTRETSYSLDYDHLYDLLRHEREHGTIVFVLGPAVVFDADSRASMQRLIEQGYAHALFAGNALATHDLEAALFHTGLGQDIYTKHSAPNGHYHHLDVINRARAAGSIEALVREYAISDGVVAACVRRGVPMVLAGSIRDDGPLPGVLADVYAAQDAMRAHTSRATTVLGLATQLHSIATGNMTPSYQVRDGVVRPVFFYSVDISEFAVNKLHDRGSLSVTSVITNVQDFMVNLARNLCRSA